MMMKNVNFETVQLYRCVFASTKKEKRLKEFAVKFRFAFVFF